VRHWWWVALTTCWSYHNFKIINSLASKRSPGYYDESLKLRYCRLDRTRLCNCSEAFDRNWGFIILSELLWIVVDPNESLSGTSPQNSKIFWESSESISSLPRHGKNMARLYSLIEYDYYWWNNLLLSGPDRAMRPESTDNSVCLGIGKIDQALMCIWFDMPFNY
jgi:hypothetical protein